MSYILCEGVMMNNGISARMEDNLRYQGSNMEKGKGQWTRFPDELKNFDVASELGDVDQSVIIEIKILEVMKLVLIWVSNI